MDPILEFSRTQLTLDNCIVPNERLYNTPSSKDGCPHDLEVQLRIVGCEYIQTAGVLLCLPQVAMATAQVLFQRFFYSKSLVKYNMTHVAMACIFLAAKIEENCRRIRDVANVFHHLKQKRMGRPVVPMEYLSDEYFKLKAHIIKYERFILKDLGFCVHVKHPHKLIIAYLQMLELEKNTQLLQKAWNYMNDSLRTNVFVRFPPEAIACACIFLAARQLKIGLPEKPPWWTVFDVTLQTIESISVEILALYQQPRVFLVDLEKKLSVLKEECAKKQIEIKEVNLKKTSLMTTPTESSSTTSSLTVEGKQTKKDRISYESPPTSLQSKPQPNSLAKTLSQKTSSLSPVPPPVTNGSRKDSITPVKNIKHHHAAFSPPRRKKPSSSPERIHSPVSDKNIHSPDYRVKPVISPIRMVSSGESYSDGSVPSPKENGIPEQYRKDFTKHKSRSKHHHHRHHHHRSSKTQHERRHHRRPRGESGHGRRGDDQPPFKIHRTDSDHRYR